jgi:lipopolysaccharide export system protein LptA
VQNGRAMAVHDIVKDISMRGARWLLLVAIAVIVVVVGRSYKAQKAILKHQALPKPAELPAGVGSVAEQWEYRRARDNHTLVEITAKDFRQAKDSAQIDLTQVELRLHHQQAGTYDLVRSAAATFFSSDERLYSEGDVDITLAVPDGQEPEPKLVSIHSSGVAFDTNTGKAETDRPATFTFRNGSGKAVGAFYDPAKHELRMQKDVEMYWNPPGPNAKTMKIEATMLYYHEETSEVWLKPWGRLTRENTVVEGYESVIHLENKAIRSVETTRARGSDEYPNRKLRYGADSIWMDFDDDGEIDKVEGDGNAQLVSTAESAETAITASRVEMNFQLNDGESVLSRVNTFGKSVLKETQLPGPAGPSARQPRETHVLRGESIELKMQPGGRNVETVHVPAAGTLEFIPTLPAQHHRMLTGKDMLIAYGPQNRIDTFRAKDAKTETDPTQDERRRDRGVTHTASRELLAKFEPGSNQMASLEQRGDFTYDEGVRRARAASATLDSKENVMVLEGMARVWDNTGSTAADHIRMDQQTGDFTADGNVNSIRLPDKGQTSSGMLSGDEPVEAQARRMVSANRNRRVHFEGNVNLWQKADRVQASVVDVDREKQTLIADGAVVTNLWEQPKANDAAEGSGTPAAKTAASPVLTVVRAPHLVYTDVNRLAVYTGGAMMSRIGIEVKSRELRAYLADEGADSRLVKAFADGSVEIVQTAADRKRTGKAEHCEYYTENQKVVLRGGEPEFIDSMKGNNTRGVELTYFANDDRLLVNGSPDQPAKSRIRRK